MAKIRLSDYVISRLEQEDIKDIFLVNGRGVLYLTDAIAKNKNINPISTHHEQAASFAAMSYAQTRKKISACLVSTGCASTNAITGVLCAYQEETPCIFISGQNTLSETTYYTKSKARSYGQQEANIINIVKPITKYATMIINADDICYELDKAIFLAKNGRKGPVWIDIPLDLQNSYVDTDNLKNYTHNQDETFSDENIRNLSTLINHAKRPIILLGLSAKDYQKEVLDFIEHVKIPVVYDSSSVDIYGRKNYFSIGAVGTMGANRSANFVIANSDLIISIGNKLNSMLVGNDKSKFARQAQIVTIDLDNTEDLKNIVDIKSSIYGNIGDILKSLATHTKEHANKEWLNKCLEYKTKFTLYEDYFLQGEKIDLYLVAKILNEKLPNNTNLIFDAGLEELILPTNIEFNQTQKCIQPSMQGCMGYALPALYGAYLANKNQSIAIIGDGSFMFNMQELQTIKHHNFPVKIIIINNNCYAVIRKRQKELFRTRTLGNDSSDGLSCVEFKNVAQCFGISYHLIKQPDELEKGIDFVLNHKGPIICEIIAKEEQAYIHSSFAKNTQNKFVQRPIEDQSPYIDRELFLSQMIVEPIDQ